MRSTTMKWALLFAMCACGAPETHFGGEAQELGFRALSPDAGTRAVSWAAIGDLVQRDPEAAEDDCHPPDSISARADRAIAPEPLPGSAGAPRLAASQLPLIDSEIDSERGEGGPTLRVVEPLQGDAVRVGSTTIAVRDAGGSDRLGFAARTRTLDTQGEPIEGLEVIRTYTVEEEAVTLSRLALVRTSDGATLDTMSSFEAPSDDCTAAAWERLAGAHPSTIRLPSDMPPVRFPPLEGCDFGQCVELREAWIRAHHGAWMAHQAMEYMQQLHPAQRSYAWSTHGAGPGGDVAPGMSSFAHWFGGYEAGRFAAVREATADLVRIFRTGQTGSRSVSVTCMDEGQSASPCFTGDSPPAGYHILKGSIRLCPRYFGRPLYRRIETTAHEPLHHVFVQLGGVKQGLRDLWTHRHGSLCTANPETERMYGPTRARHLATYTNANGEDCGHRRLAVLNISNYDEFIRRWGEALWNRTMTRWPVWGDPTPQPPECDESDLGEEGCQCAAAVYDDVPEGDFAMGMICPDIDGHEVTCSATTFGTQSYGVCRSCEGTQRPGGCSCTSTEQCALGLGCFGADTHGSGGVGHCYEAEPPSWACLADCQRLYNDEGATCYQDPPTGGRCLDSFCAPWEAEACFQQGRVCREGECVVECNSEADCTELGYPAETFECISHQCRRASWL